MKKLSATILLVLISCAAIAQEVRVMSMNIKEGGMMAGYLASPYATLINEYHPDFVCLQEVDHRTIRNGSRDFIDDLAVLTGMFPYYCQSFSYQNGGFGVALLSKYPFYKAEKHIATIEGAKEPRATGWVYVMLHGGKHIRVASTHLALESAEITTRNIAIVNSRILLDKTTPTLLIGDFNCTPDSDAIAYAKQNWQEIGAGSGNTIPSNAPTKQLDYVMGFPKKWSCLSYTIIAKPNLSDHCFVIADVKYEE